METVRFIQSVFRNERTLVITCHECCLDALEAEGSGNVFRYSSLGNIINNGDELQFEQILNFVEFKKCKHIVVAGHHQCRAIDYLRSAAPKNSPLVGPAQWLTRLFADHHGSLMPESAQKPMIIEVNILKQCDYLYSLPQLQERIHSGTLTISGVVLDPSGLHRKVYSNGIAYNHFLSMN